MSADERTPVLTTSSAGPELIVGLMERDGDAVIKITNSILVLFAIYRDCALRFHRRSYKSWINPKINSRFVRTVVKSESASRSQITLEFVILITSRPPSSRALNDLIIRIRLRVQDGYRRDCYRYNAAYIRVLELMRPITFAISLLDTR